VGSHLVDVDLEESSMEEGVGQLEVNGGDGLASEEHEREQA
jgi:hypothetical protein